MDNYTTGDNGGLDVYAYMDSDYMDMINCLQQTPSSDNLTNYTAVSNTTPCNLNDLDFGKMGMDANSAEFDVLKAPGFALLTVVLYVIVIVLGAAGNTMVVITVAKTRQMWNATNIFICNLALTDVFVCIFDLPLSVYYQITDDWRFGQVLCHIIPAGFAVVVYASTLTLAMIAVDRFILIVYPLARKMTVQVALLLVLLIALFSMAVASPIAIFAQYLEIDDSQFNLHRRYCTETWPSKHQRHLYTVITLLLQYFVPLLLIAALYALIFRRISSRVQPQKKGHNRRTKTTKMLVAVVAAFALTWTPFHIFSLISEFDSSMVSGRYYKFLDSMLRVLAMSSSCINPLLYGWLNDNYRNAFLGMLKRPGAGARRFVREDVTTETTQTNKTSVISTIRKVNTKTTMFDCLRKKGRYGEKKRQGIEGRDNMYALTQLDEASADMVQTQVIANGQTLALDVSRGASGSSPSPRSAERPLLL